MEFSDPVGLAYGLALRDYTANLGSKAGVFSPMTVPNDDLRKLALIKALNQYLIAIGNM